MDLVGHLVAERSSTVKFGAAISKRAAAGGRVRVSWRGQDGLEGSFRRDAQPARHPRDRAVQQPTAGMTMVWSEFEEKSYEIAAAIELSRGRAPFGRVFAPGQVLEGLLGFDSASSPNPRHPIWQVLNTPRPPGVRLVPGLWSIPGAPSASQLPSSPVSLVLQYKRPEYLRGGRSAQWSAWRRPYFRITRTLQQQQVLARLERRLENDAIVSYAAPAFWTMAELEAGQLAGTVLRQSGFVRPTQLTGHSVWTYRLPGTDGFVNPRLERRHFQTVDEVANRSFRLDFMEERRDLVIVQGTLRDHVRRIAIAADERAPTVRSLVNAWVVRLLEAGLDHDSAAVVRDVATISSVLARVGATWLVLDSAD